MREVVCINVGQAGVQIGNASWELLCVEHGIEASGRLKLNLLDDDSTAFMTFFEELSNGQFVPRSLIIDLEPTVIDEVRKGCYRNLFHPDYLLNTYEDASNNYARGHFTIGKKILPRVENGIRRLVERCGFLQGFFITHSIGGGTGGGLTTSIQDKISVDYCKLPRHCMSVFPSPVLANAIVEPYNSVMSIRDSQGKSDIQNIFNNQALYRICEDMLDIGHPTFSNINRVLTHVFSDVTVSLRFESTLNSDLVQIGTNLIPFPKIHFIMAAHAPISSMVRSKHEKLTVKLLTRNLFKTSHQLISVDMEDCAFMSCVLQYRGDVSPQEVGQVLSAMRQKKEIKFVDWCPTGFKVGINSQPPSTIRSSEMAQTIRSGSSLINASVIIQPMSNLLRKFSILFAKRSFVHWYVGEGMEEGEFNEARDDITTIITDYKEITYIEPKEEVQPPNKASFTGYKKIKKQVGLNHIKSLEGILSSQHTKSSGENLKVKKETNESKETAPGSSSFDNSKEEIVDSGNRTDEDEIESVEVNEKQIDRKNDRKSVVKIDQPSLDSESYSEYYEESSKVRHDDDSQSYGMNDGSYLGND